MGTVASIPVSSTTPRCTSALHESLKADPKRWASLELADYWAFGSLLAEQRQCPGCHSTLARPIQVLAVRYLDEQSSHEHSTPRGAQ